MRKARLVICFILLLFMVTFLSLAATTNVRGQESKQGTDIKDIKGPLEMKTNWAPYRKALCWLAIILILALGLWWWLARKKKVSSTHDSGPPPLPAHEAALRELEKIWDAFLKNKRIKEFYFQLSEIIRQYLSRRYQINALEATTEELLQELKAQPIQFQHRALLSEFLNECDLVKFAKYMPEIAQTEQLYQMAFQVINNTRVIENTCSEVRAKQGQQD